MSVAVDGAPPPGAPLGAKELALLAFLAFESRAHSRDALAALLWGDFPEERARASLRQALAHLRVALGDALHVERATVSLAATVDGDVHALLAARPPRAAVLDTEPARFLADLPLRHCGAFDEWVDATRAALHRRRAALLAEHARDALARLDWHGAAETAARWFAADPGDDGAVRVLMEARHLGGDGAGALAAYAEHRACLAADGARAPSRAARALAERVERDAAARGASSGGARAAAHLPPSALRGRDAAWGALCGAWRAAAAGSARVALLEGELGAGKTRLVDDFARWVAAGGGLVLRATAREAGSAVPFGVAADVMRAALDAPGVAGASGEWLSEIARLVPALRERLPGVPVPPLPANGEGWRLYEAVAQLLLALAGEQPVLVVVDDLPWADAESVALLRFVVERLPATPVLWCATATHGSADRDAPGRRLTRALRAAPDALVLELGPLAEGDVWELLRDLGRLPDTTAARGFARLVHAETAGTPQYVLALVEALLASGEVAHAADGSWVLPSDPLWTPADAMRAAPSARASVLARMERLPDDAREVLRAIAVADGWCSAPLLSEVLSVSRLRAASLGDALVERGLVTEAAGEYRCAHPVVARVVRDATSTAWRREMHRALALALGAPSGGDVLPDAGLAWHAGPAGDRGAARPPAPLPDRVAALAPAPPGTPA